MKTWFDDNPGVIIIGIAMLSTCALAIATSCNPASPPVVDCSDFRTSQQVERIADILEQRCPCDFRETR